MRPKGLAVLAVLAALIFGGAGAAHADPTTSPTPTPGQPSMQQGPQEFLPGQQGGFEVFFPAIGFGWQVGPYYSGFGDGWCPPGCAVTSSDS